MALNFVTLSSKLFFPPSLRALKEDIPAQLGDFHSQWLRWISCACTGMHGELPCYSMWLCLRSHLSTEWASPGKWKGGTHKWNCWRPRLAQRMTQTPGAVWPGRAMLTPTPTTAQAHVKPGGVQRQQSNSEGARLWPVLIQALPQLMQRTGLWFQPIDQRRPRKRVSCCSEPPWA